MRNKERNYSRAKFNLKNTSLNKVTDMFTWHEALAQYYLSVGEYQTPVTIMRSLKMITRRSGGASSFDRELVPPEGGRLCVFQSFEGVFVE